MMKFNEKYQPDDFLQFLQDFLPEDFSEKEEDVVINKERYKVMTGARVLGYCSSLDLYILEMGHAREKDPRVTITTDAFKILADNWIHRALVVFRNKDTENYRLSYLTIALDLNDKNKAVKRYSNARRYSFYLGANAKVRTPEQQLIKKGRIKDIDDLLSRFSVEVVNKQFYLEVAKYFDELVSGEDKNLSLPSVSQENINVRKSFAVRLIGRLMFCWFLKQKKSESGQLIPDELLSSNVARKTDGYYHSILEPLFFEVLNTSVDTRGIRSELFDKVPYLNGGLFNPQPEDYYELDGGTFFSKHINTLSISDQWFVNFFELLELYNFTIDENTVFDQELSVDPEMLGRIFENLLAEMNPETGSSERKRTGSFYTPRQIVEYMVDQSLIEYFKTKTGIEESKLAALVSYDLNDDADYPLSDDEKRRVVIAIETLKLLDPACGSGAYPIGALQKIVYILQIIDPDCKLWLEEKLKDVPDLYKQKIINEVRSNPFDYTRKLDVIKNSIFGVDIQPIAVDVSRLRCFLTLVVESEIDDTKSNRGIEPLPNLDFKFVCANTLIGLPKAESSGLFDDHSGITELSKIMSEYFSCNSQRKNEIRLKFLHVQKDILEKTISAFGKSTGELTLKLTTWNPFSNNSNSWFDPEWMFGLEEKFDIVIGNPPYVNIRKLDSGLKDMYQKLFMAASGQYDLYVLFIEKSLSLVDQGGLVTFITSNKFLISGYGKNIRKIIAEKSTIIDFVDYSKERVFEGVSVYPVVFLLKNRDSITPILKEDYNLLKVFGFEKNDSVIEKVDGIKTTLDDYCIIKEAIHTGNIRNKLISDEQLSDHSYKLLRGKDCGRYGLFWNGLYINYDVLPNKELGEYANLIDKEYFLSPKVFLREIALRPTAVYDSDGYFCLNKSYVIKGKSENLDLRYIVAILNSKLIAYFFEKKFGDFRVGGGYLQFKKQFTSKIPMVIDSTLGEEILEKSIEIHKIKKQDYSIDTTDLEIKIDELVMDLYGLNDEEKEVIRNL